MQDGTQFESKSEAGAIFNQDKVCVVDAALVEKLKEEARVSKLGRYRVCMHHSPEEPVQDMIIVHTRGNYSRPHCHPDAAMSYAMIEGRLDVLLFDGDGNVTRRIRLGAMGEKGVDAVSLRLAAGVTYMPVCLTETAVFHETLTAPNPDGVANVYPVWAPTADDPERIEEFYRAVGVDVERYD